MDTTTLSCMHHVDCGCKTCTELYESMPLFEWFKWHEVPSPSLPTLTYIIDKMYMVRDDCLSRYNVCTEGGNAENEYITETIWDVILQAERQANYRRRFGKQFIERPEPVSMSKIIEQLYTIHEACETIDNTEYITQVIWSLIQQVK